MITQIAEKFAHTTQIAEKFAHTKIKANKHKEKVTKRLYFLRKVC